LFVNEATNIIWIIDNWKSNAHFVDYITWIQTKDTTIAGMLPFLVGGEAGLKIVQGNSNYQSF